MFECSFLGVVTRGQDEVSDVSMSPNANPPPGLITSATTEDSSVEDHPNITRPPPDLLPPPRLDILCPILPTMLVLQRNAGKGASTQACFSYVQRSHDWLIPNSFTMSASPRSGSSNLISHNPTGKEKKSTLENLSHVIMCNSCQIFLHQY